MTQKKSPPKRETKKQAKTVEHTLKSLVKNRLKIVQVQK